MFPSCTAANVVSGTMNLCCRQASRRKDPIKEARKIPREIANPGSQIFNAASLSFLDDYISSFLEF